jgi:hypothetical protein
MFKVMTWSVENLSDQSQKCPSPSGRLLRTPQTGQTVEPRPHYLGRRAGRCQQGAPRRRNGQSTVPRLPQSVYELGEGNDIAEERRMRANPARPGWFL